MTSSPTYAVDDTGLLAANAIINEQHLVTESQLQDYTFIIPIYAPYYPESMTLRLKVGDDIRLLVESVDFVYALPFLAASEAVGQLLYGAIVINPAITLGILSIDYQTYGGPFAEVSQQVLERLANHIYNSKVSVWDSLTPVPLCAELLNPLTNPLASYGQRQLIDALIALSVAIANRPDEAAIIRHLVNRENPHETTFAHVAPLMATDTEVMLRQSLRKLITLRQLLALVVAFLDNSTILLTEINDRLTTEADQPVNF